MSKFHYEKLIDEKTIDDKIREIAKKISEDYKGEPVHLIGTLKGSVIFLGRLLSLIESEKLTIDFIAASSYGGGINSSGSIRILKDLDVPIEGRNVIIVEDIVDTGTTMKYLTDMFKTRKPKSIKICTLLDKPSRRIEDIKADYVGFEIEDVFVLGYGLDYDELYRNLPYIGKVIFD